MNDQTEARCTFCNEVGSFPHTCKTPATELVATFQPESDAGVVSVCFTLSWLETLGVDAEGWADDDIEGPIGVIRLSRKPVGFVDSLPEFPGW